MAPYAYGSLFLALSKVSMIMYMKKQIKQLELNKSSGKKQKQNKDIISVYSSYSVSEQKCTYTWKTQGASHYSVVVCCYNVKEVSE